MQAAAAEDTAGLKRELGVRDLTLFAITTIVATRWIPAAAHAGPTSILLWFAAALFFVVPLAIAVAALTLKYPGTGGMYVWARNDFGPWHGFLCFWIYWLSMAFWFPSAALFYMSAGLHALGPAYAHISNSRTWLLIISLAAIWIALATNLVGLRIGKWVENVGGASAWLLAAVLGGVATLVWIREGSATSIHVIPKFEWQMVSFWSSIAYAMSGLELAALIGSEVHDPARSYPRAAWVASIFTTLFYASTTTAMMILVPADSIHEMYGFSQAGERAAGVLAAWWIAPLLAVIVLLSAIGQFGGIGTAISRLPFIAGVDQLLPKPFAAIHPRWRTPYVSILFLGVVASVLLVGMQIGDSARAAYQEMISLMLIGGFVPYIYMFGCAWKAGRRVSAASGLLITGIAIACSIVPTYDITNVWLFEGKLIGGTVAVILSAFAVYRRAPRRV